MSCSVSDIFDLRHTSITHLSFYNATPHLRRWWDTCPIVLTPFHSNRIYYTSPRLQTFLSLLIWTLISSTDLWDSGGASPKKHTLDLTHSDLLRSSAGHAANVSFLLASMLNLRPVMFNTHVWKEIDGRLSACRCVVPLPVDWSAEALMVAVIKTWKEKSMK